MEERKALLIVRERRGRGDHDGFVAYGDETDYRKGGAAGFTYQETAGFVFSGDPQSYISYFFLAAISEEITEMANTLRIKRSTGSVYYEWTATL